MKLEKCGGGVICNFRIAEFFVSASSLSSRESDVRMVGAIFRNEAARRCGRGDRLLEYEEPRGDVDVDEEDAGAIEGAERAELDMDGHVVQRAQTCDDAL